MSERPAWEGAETSSPTPVREGDTLGVYRISSRLGAGGMGEVFCAVDTRLERTVALKVCRTPFNQRFEREARTLASLNHPHICTLFDIGPNYLVMELIEGSTLAARMRQAPLPLDEVALFGAQIADALAEAHRAGIVHRDLKPQNIMVTRHGIKVLDFGIARVVDDPAFTATGAVIGTPTYMAPEQLEGKPATQQADLFALGLVLYEMATGGLPIPGASFARVLLDGGAIAPVPKSRRKAIPAELDALIAGLLVVDPAMRAPSAAEAGDRLRRLVAPRRRLRQRTGWLAAVALVALAVSASGWWLLRTGEPAPLQVARLTPFTTVPGPKFDPAYSPDGSSLAFLWRGEAGNEPGIYVIQSGAEQPTRLTSTATDISPAWSPDGKAIAFLRVHSGQTNELMLVSVSGVPQGSPPGERKLRDARQPEIVTRRRRPVLTWTPDGTAIVLPLQDTESGLTSLFRVGIEGGTPRRVIESQGGLGDTTPAFTRGGEWLAYSDFESSGSQLYVLKMGPGGIAEGDRQPVPGSLGAVASPLWSPDGRHLLWASGARLMEWEPGSGARAVYVAADAFAGMTATWKTDSIPEIVFANLGASTELHMLKLKDGGRAADGPSTPIIRLAGGQTNPALSPDGRWLAFNAPGTSGSGEVWIAEASGDNPRLLASMNAGAAIVWSPDSRHIAFHARAPSTAQVYVVDVDEEGRAGTPRQVTHSAFSLFGPSWSADGQYLYVTGNRSPTSQRVLRSPAAGGEVEDLFEGDSQKVALDGHGIFYAKSQQMGIYERSLDGDVASNPETRIIEDYVPPLGFVPGRNGIYYVGRDASRRPSALSYYDYSLRKSYNLAPPPSSPVPVLTVSPDGSRLILERASPFTPELTRMEFRQPGD